MITDDERREVARSLQECKSHIDAAGWFWLNDELGGAHIVASSEERLRRGTALLADLIKPSEPEVRCVAEVKVDGEQLEKLVHDAVVKLTGIDRDALLELAEDVEEAAAMAVVMDASKGAKLLADMLLDIARRIREACGEVIG